MNCDIFSLLCLRANGRFSCYCDAGHEIELAEATAAVDWSVGQVFGGRSYRLARALFRRGFAAWGDTCARCVLYQRDLPFIHDRPTKQLRQVLFEPSSACALRCPACPRAELAPKRSGSVFLSVEIWRRVLQSLREEGYSVGSFLSTGLGDPLTHPRIEDLVESVREFFPTSPITINSNANYRFAEVFPRGVYPDRLLLSVDGVHQRSYEQYRINGDVATAFEFMRAARRAPGHRPAVDWKYILFAHNDSHEELIAAQRTAASLEVDSLQFVLTHTPQKSLRFTAANGHELPIVWSGAYLDAVCQLHYKRRIPRALSPNDSEAQPGSAAVNLVRVRIDSCSCWSDRMIVRGWAMGRNGSRPRRMAIQVNDDAPAEARIGLVREDVWHVFPALGNRTAGFDAQLALPAQWSRGRVTITVIYETTDGDVFRFPVDYDLGASVEEE